jgi:hypothetical protein
MRVRFIALTLAVCEAFLVAIPLSREPAEPQQAEMIDFDALRMQAAAALETLQQLHERRLASVAATAF